MLNVYAVAACHRPDIEKMKEALGHLGFPKDRVVVVANGVDPPTTEDFPEATVITYPTLEYCMPHWWNLGLEYITARETENYEVFVFNADTFAKGSDVLILAKALRDYDLAATGPDQTGLVTSDIYIETRLTPQDIRFRLPGYAFVLRGELELRADPKFRHWYIDDDIEWQARSHGGTGLVKGVRVQHPIEGNTLTPMLVEFAHEDLERFKDKWGTYPH